MRRSPAEVERKSFCQQFVGWWKVGRRGLREGVVFICVSLYLLLFKRLKMVVELKRWLSGQEQ